MERMPGGISSRRRKEKSDIYFTKSFLFRLTYGILSADCMKQINTEEES